MFGDKDEKMKGAEILKEKANECFKRQEFSPAIDFYSEAIDLNPNCATYYGNRSITYLKMECFGYALADATKALELDKNYIKGYYRRAAAKMAMGKFKEALKDFETVVKVRPKDPDAKSKFQECNKIVKRIAFEKAISVDEVKRSVSASINVDQMTIEDDYSGPQLVEGKVTIDFMKELMETFKDCKSLHKKYAYKIILDIKELFEKQPTLVDITVGDDDKFTVCGDIHGQYFDLLNIFELNGLPSENNPYLFNGDFVDRGSFSVECILVLFGFKLLFPNHFFMARGNHESQTMNQMYGFEGEVKAKYSVQMYDLFAEVFNLLPLTHCINKRVLVMHGGIFSKDTITLEDIRLTDRNRQPPDEGIMCELLWSDPMPQQGRAPSKRGVGVQFGPDVTETFCKLNSLDYIIRSHEVKSDGYEVAHDGRCITVFSAPNYCDTMGNKGAFITMNGSDMQPNYVTYSEVPHPNVKPMAYASSLFSFM
ncbi:Serine/threonine-protein phosphatase 5 [Halotydeus destructor]|nr:Serine/threonine-protein phosphatase 5 [Halotydeus destructor]